MNFPFDAFLSYNSKDKSAVREIADRLKKDGVLLLCMSANAIGSDWAQLEAGTCGRGNLPFRDPLNRESRFLSLRQTKTTPSVN